MNIRSCLGVLVAALSAACGSQPATSASPVSPSPVPLAPVASYAGDWTVDAIQTVCTSGSRYTCPWAPVKPATHSLRLSQIGAHVVGMLDGIDVSGDVGADGRLQLTGRGTVPDYGGTSNVTSFDVVLDANHGLDGRFTMDWWIPENYEPLGGAHHSEHTVLGATRGALPASFAGRWVGNFQTPGCIDARCAGPEKEFELQLDDIGGVLTGTLELRLHLRAALVGAAAGTTAELTSAPNAAASDSFRLTAMHLERSATGRLTGVFTLEYPRGQVDTLELVQVSLVAAP